jgi:hypothetical protein
VVPIRAVRVDLMRDDQIVPSQAIGDINVTASLDGRTIDWDHRLHDEGRGFRRG